MRMRQVKLNKLIKSQKRMGISMKKSGLKMVALVTCFVLFASSFVVHMYGDDATSPLNVIYGNYNNVANVSPAAIGIMPFFDPLLDITYAFTCPNFEAVVRELPLVSATGDILWGEVEGVHDLFVFDRGITSIDGIEYFTSLDSLTLNSNPITSVDLSNNPTLVWLNVGNNQLNSIDVSNNAALLGLVVERNPLTYLDLSNNPALGSLDVSDTQITSLDLSNNPALSILQIGGFNFFLTSLNISNTDLTSLSLTGLMSGSLALTANNIPTLEVTHAPAAPFGWPFTIVEGDALTTLDISNTAITSLTLNNVPLLETITAENTTRLSSVDISAVPELRDLTITGSQLTSLDISNSTGLVMANLSNNQLTSLDTTGNPDLSVLDVSNNQLSTINISNSTLLEGLDVSNNMLTGINLDNNAALSILNVSSNRLTSLDISAPNFLWSVYAANNRLTTLDVSTQNSLIELDLRYNDIDSSDDVVGWQGLFSVVDFGGFMFSPQGFYPNLDITSAFTCPNFYAVVRELPLVQPAGPILAGQVVGVTHVDAPSRGITSLDGIEYFTALTGLSAPNNQFTSLNVSNNSNLGSLDVSGNQLTNLDISNNILLGTLVARNNQLTTLDVSELNNLDWLDLRYNDIAHTDDVIGWQNHFDDIDDPIDMGGWYSVFMFTPQNITHPTDDPTDPIIPTPPGGDNGTDDDGTTDPPTIDPPDPPTNHLPPSDPGYEFIIPLPPVIIEIDDFRVVSRGNYYYFVTLYLNDRRLIRNYHYIVHPGSTVFTVWAHTFEDLEPGRHTLTANFHEGNNPENLRRATQYFYINIGGATPGLPGYTGGSGRPTPQPSPQSTESSADTASPQLQQTSTVTVFANGGAAELQSRTIRGITTLLMPNATINELINTAIGNTITIDLTEISDINYVIMPNTAANRFAQAGLSLRIYTSDITVELNPEALQNMAAVARQVTISITETSDETTQETEQAQPPTPQVAPVITPASTQPPTLRFEIGQTNITANGTPATADAAPFIHEGRAMIPLRLIAESLGATANWNESTRTAEITSGTTTITLNPDTPLPGGMGMPMIVNDRIFVPTRYVSEMLGAQVRWDEVYRAVYVYA